MTTLHVQVEGRVQGVGFRWFTRQCAKRNGLFGWVENRADGTVEIAAKGGEAELQRFRRALESGPPGAEVTAVKDLPGIAEGELGNSFEVKR